jgi:hypothetical protein
MSDTTGFKITLATRHMDVIPTSRMRYLKQRKNWIELLLKSVNGDQGKDIIPITGTERMGIGKISSIHPNPAKDIIFLDYEIRQEGEIAVSLYNNQGQQLRLYNFARKIPGNYQETLILPPLQGGLIFISLIFNGARIDSKKIVHLD